MIEEGEDQFQTSTGGGIPIRDIEQTNSPWEEEVKPVETVAPRVAPEPQTYTAEETASSDYFATPSPTPLQSTAVIDDETARKYLEEYKGLPPGVDDERAKKLNMELDRYFAGDAERKKDETENFFLKNYTDPNSLNELAKDPKIKLRESQSMTPELERKKMLNWSWLQEQTGLPIATENEYVLARDKWASEHDGLAKMTDQQFFDTRKKQYETLAERRMMNIDVIGLGTKQALEDENKGVPTDMTKVFEKIKGKYPQHFDDPEVAGQTMAMLKLVGEDVKNATDQIRPLVAEAYPILQRVATKQATPEDIKALTTFYKNNPQQFDAVLQAASTILHVEDEKVDSGKLKIIWDELQNVGKAVKEGVIGPLVNSSRVAQEVWARDQMANLQTPAPEAAGLIETGNINIHNRPVVRNPDGSISTVRSISIDEDGTSVLIPTVVDGKVVSNEEAIKHYKETGEHLGKFEDETAATAYAQSLHEQQAAEYDPARAKLQSDYQMVLDVLDMERALDKFRRQEVDPINYHFDPNTWGGRLERGTLGAVQSAPLMAAAWVAHAAGTYVGGPVVGMMAADAVMGLATRDQEYEDMRRNGVPHDKAMFWSSASAVAQLPLNHLEFKIDVGRFAALNRTMGIVKNGQLSKLAGLGGRQLAAEAIEWTGEMGQNAMQAFAAEIATQAKLNLPKAEQKVWDDAQAQGWETFFATLPFTMFGTGVAHFSEESALQLLSRENLTLIGFSEEAIMRIHAATSVEGMQTQANKELKAMTPEDRARGAEQIRQEQNKAEAAATDMRDDPVMPHIEREVKPDGTINYRVVKANGEVAMETGSATAAEVGLTEQGKAAKAEEKQAIQEAATSDEGVVAEAEQRTLKELLPDEGPGGVVPGGVPPITTTAPTYPDWTKLPEGSPERAAGQQAELSRGFYDRVFEQLKDNNLPTQPGEARLAALEAFKRGEIKSPEELRAWFNKSPYAWEKEAERKVDIYAKAAPAPEAAPAAAPKGQVEVTMYDEKAREFTKVREKATMKLQAKLSVEENLLQKVTECLNK